MKKKVVVAGATGLVGYAALKHFGRQPGVEVHGDGDVVSGAGSGRRDGRRDAAGVRHVARDIARTHHHGKYAGTVEVAPGTVQVGCAY